jgi:CDP-diacylglycerol--serine O-phosphatidyltransferase
VKYYEGTPIPTSLAIVAVLAIAFATGHHDDSLWLGALAIGPSSLHPLVFLYAVSGSLMVSATIRVPKP